MKTSIKLEALIALTDSVLQELGLRNLEREVVLEVLLYAEMRGKSQGLVKILERTVVPDENRSEMGIVQRTSCIHHLQANGNLGMLVLREAADRAIAACREHGMGLSLTSGTCTSTGSIGYYAERIARAGFIGVVMAGSPKVMALHGSAQRSLGTNPIAFAMPTQTDPLVCDMATSAITWFEIIRLVREDGSLPAGVAIDADGQPTQSPKAALEGVLLPFAGSKGSGLALMVECLTGPLTGANLLHDNGDNRGNFVLAINPDAALPVSTENDATENNSSAASSFTERMSLMLQRMQAGAGGDFRFPGQRSQELAHQCQLSGDIEIDHSVLSELRQMSAG